MCSGGPPHIPGTCGRPESDPEIVDHLRSKGVEVPPLGGNSDPLGKSWGPAPAGVSHPLTDAWSLFDDGRKDPSFDPGLAFDRPECGHVLWKVFEQGGESIGRSTKRLTLREAHAFAFGLRSRLPIPQEIIWQADHASEPVAL